MIFTGMTDCNRRLMAIDSNGMEWMVNEKTPFIILAELQTESIYKIMKVLSRINLMLCLVL